MHKGIKAMSRLKKKNCFDLRTKLPPPDLQSLPKDMFIYRFFSQGFRRGFRVGIHVENHIGSLSHCCQWESAVQTFSTTDMKSAM